MKKRTKRIVAAILAILTWTGCNTANVVEEAEENTEAVLSGNVTEGSEIEEISADYIKLLGFETNSDKFGERSFATYEAGFGNVIQSGTMWVEEWYEGECIKSIPGILSPKVEEIYLVMDVSVEGTTRVMLSTDEYDGVWEMQIPFPFGAEEVSDYCFTAYDEGYEAELAPGEEWILSTVAFDMGNGTEYCLVIRAAFEADTYELTEKAPDGSYPTNVFRLEEVVTIEDEDRKNAYISALENILYKRISPTGDETEDWTVGVNSYGIMDVNFDGKEELLIKHESAMADTKLCIFGYDEEMETLQRLYWNYPALTFYDNGAIIAEVSHNQNENEFWPYTLWMLDEDNGIYEAVVSVDNEKKDVEVREQYIGDANIMEMPLERLPYTLPNGAA